MNGYVPPRGPGFKQVLIVDDDLDIIKLIASRLKANGYGVHGASDGKACLELAARVHPDLIILDIVMPGMSGLDVLHRLKTTTGTDLIPVIMLTQKGETGSILDAEQLGATDYLAKPFDPEALLKVIARYI